MPDTHFTHPRLASIYDDLDPDRSDLDHYAAIIDEFTARSVLDVGCGTGTLATTLALRGLGNVAQVFLDDADWSTALGDIHRTLRPSGHFVFESRDPRRRGWEEWTPERTRSLTEIAGVGPVEYFVELLDVSLPFVSFRSTYRFRLDGSVLTSDSTLRFRERDEFEASLESAGFTVTDVRDAPDRPGREFVFIARRT